MRYPTGVNVRVLGSMQLGAAPSPTTPFLDDTLLPQPTVSSPPGGGPPYPDLGTAAQAMLYAFHAVVATSQNPPNPGPQPSDYNAYAAACYYIYKAATASGASLAQVNGMAQLLADAESSGSAAPYFGSTSQVPSSGMALKIGAVGLIGAGGFAAALGHAKPGGGLVLAGGALLLYAIFKG